MNQIQMIVKSAGITVFIAWLYYRNLWAVFILSPVGIWYYARLQKECIYRKKQEFIMQFKEMIQIFSSLLNTGYSVENALRESQKELRILYTEKAAILRELGILVRQMQVKIPVEQAIEEFSGRVQLEDVVSFAEVFITAKRSGGDMIAIIQNTVNQMGDKIDVRREIDTMLAAKKYEFKVMSVIPFLIIAYMSLSFPEFMDCLYGNIAGTGVMTVCLIIYITAYYLGLKISAIEV